MEVVNSAQQSGGHKPSKSEIDDEWIEGRYKWCKELDCLYRIQKKIAAARSSDRSGADEIFQMMANELREALRYPKLASVRIAIGYKEFKSQNYQEGKCKQPADIAIYGQKIGTLEVNYLSKIKQIDITSFTEPEKLLLDIVAHWAWGVNQNYTIENNLRKSSLRLLTLLENLPDNIYEVDTEMNVLWTNKDPQDLGRKCHYIHFKRRHPCIGCPLAKAISTGRKHTETMKHSIKGTYNYWEVTAVPIKDKYSNVTSVIGVARNATHRINSEEKLQAANRLALIGQMASGIAHEINNPLSGIMSFSGLLMRQPAAEDSTEAVQIIHEGALRVSDIVKRLLRFARPRIPSRKCVDVNAAVMATLNLQRYSLADERITVITDLSPNLPTIIADEAQMQELCHNLIANARTEMKLANNGGTLFVRTQLTGNVIRLYFNDDGPGISTENIEKLFTPFFTTRPIGEGTGLGLSICHNIVREHNGRIYIKSQLGKGASFVVELPANRCDDYPNNNRDIMPELSKPSNLSILVVDDDLIVRRSLKGVLGSSGHKVETVSNAHEALAKLDCGEYDLIILDVKLPDFSGIELYKIIEEKHPVLTKRIIFITGDIIGQDTLNFFSESKLNYLIKPIHITDMERAIAKTIAQNETAK